MNGGTKGPEKKKKKTKSDDRPSAFRVWWTAARPHTLTASICPCLVSWAGCRPAAGRTDDLLLWLTFCVTVQIGTNLHNDYADAVMKVDTDQRVGQARATAKGWLSPKQTATAAVGTLCVTLLAGILLGYNTGQLQNGFYWFLILSSVFNAFAYTGGPFPLGLAGIPPTWSIARAGLGELFVFLYFGLVASCMLPYLLWCQGRRSDLTADVLHGCQVGLLAVNIIVVNNLRDRYTDKTAKKLTTAVQFGRTFSLIEYCVCLTTAYASVLLDDKRKGGSYYQLLPLLSMPFAIVECLAVIQTEGSDLNKHVGLTALVETAFCVLLSLSLWLDQ
jgi:1,4-dihydroxy-2-naphthoate octaprenyltransferase